MSYEKSTDLMSDNQKDAIEKAYALLGEHFENVLICVNFEYSAVGGASQDLGEAQALYWKGGSMTALGLAAFAHERILTAGQSAAEP